MSDPTPPGDGAASHPAPPPRGRPRLREAALTAAVALAAALPVALWLTRVPTLVARDTSRLYQPLRGLVVEALRDWRLPLWNPYEGTGKPLLAEGLHGALHPLSVLMAWVAPASLDALLLAYLLAAAAGTFLLARALGRSSGAAALAAFAYALSGYVVSMTGNLVFLAGAASLPWLTLALRACAAPGPGPILLSALATAAALLGGEAQTTALGVLLGAALAVEAGGLRTAGRLAGGVALGALLAGVQLVPTLAHLQRTARHLGLTEEEQVQWALSPWRLLELASPGFFGSAEASLDAPVFQGLAPSPGYTIPFADSAFLGLPVLLLALRGARAGRAALVLAASAALLLWLALGHQAGATQALGWVPVWSTFRYTEKLLGPLSLVLALLASGGLDAALGAARPVGRAALAVAGAALAAWALLVSSEWIFEPALAALGHPGVAAEARLRLAAGLPILLGGALALAAALHAPLRPPVRAWLAAAVVLAGSAAALPFAIHPAPITCPGPGWLARLEAEPPGPRIAVPNYHEQAGSSAESRDRSWCDLATMGLASYNALARVDELDTYTGLDTVRFLKVFVGLGEDRWRAFRRFGLTHLVIHPAVGEAEARTLERAVAGGQPVPAPSGGRWQAFAVPHRPWATFAPAVVAAPDPEGTLRRLQSLIAEGSEVVVIQAAAPVPAAPGRILSVRREAERLEVVAEADGAALLVVNDAFWPGWRARVDGAEVPVLAADVLSRGVLFPPGRHVVVMRYEPPEVAWGLAATALGAVGCLVLGWLAWRRGRR